MKSEIAETIHAIVVIILFGTAFMLIGYKLGERNTQKETENPALTEKEWQGGLRTIYNNTDSNVYISTTTDKKSLEVYFSLPYYEPMQSGLRFSQININVNTNFQSIEEEINWILKRLYKLEAGK